VKFGAVVRTALVWDNGSSWRYPSFDEIRDTAQRMEEAGFDSLWLFDHLLYRDPGEPTTGLWECWTMLSALAAVTERIELGPLVLCVPFRNPGILAKMATTLDEISSGRLILGLGAGWHEPEFEAFDLPFDHRAARFEEALQIIVPLFQEGRVDFEGRYHQARNAALLPRGPAPKGPPLLIGAWGPRLMRLAVEYGRMWNGGYSGRIDSFRERLANFEAARAVAGKGPAEVEATALLKVGWPDLTEIPAFFEGEYVTGSAGEMAQAFKEYEEAGVAHVMCQYYPNTTEALDRLISAFHAYRALSAAP
jgi:probable F420-dependent oxidoreductase